MEQDDPDFYRQVLAGKYELPGTDKSLAEDDVPEDDDEDGAEQYDDDSSVNMDDAIRFLLQGQFENAPLVQDANGNLQSTGEAETLAEEEEMENIDYFAVVEDGGRGKRRKMLSEKVMDIMQSLK
jgi:hypothetical protein